MIDELDNSNTDFCSAKKETFVVHVKYRSNNTWQGTIEWVEENKTQHFRSALEMLKLMDTAVERDHPVSVSWE